MGFIMISVERISQILVADGISSSQEEYILIAVKEEPTVNETPVSHEEKSVEFEIEEDNLEEEEDAEEAEKEDAEEAEEEDAEEAEEAYEAVMRRVKEQGAVPNACVRDQLDEHFGVKHR